MHAPTEMLVMYQLTCSPDSRLGLLRLYDVIHPVMPMAVPAGGIDTLRGGVYVQYACMCV